MIVKCKYTFLEVKRKENSPIIGSLMLALLGKVGVEFFKIAFIITKM
jgi:hypothetical protein